jgi:hypothetical protein
MGAGDSFRVWNGPTSRPDRFARRTVGAYRLTCRRADDEQGFRSAFRLIYFAYLRGGLTVANQVELRFLPHHLLATSSVLLAASGGQNVGTLSLIEDGELGVPTELLYPLDVARLRGGGKRIAELACLATAHADRGLSRLTLRALLQFALQLADMRGIELLTVCVHPRHERFYRKGLGFVPFGAPRSCPWVCGQPAIAMYRPLRGVKVANFLSVENELPFCNLPNATLDHCRDASREVFARYLEVASPIPWPLRRVAAA